MLTLMQIYVRIDILHTGITYIFTCKVPVGLIFYFNASYILKRKKNARTIPVIYLSKPINTEIIGAGHAALLSSGFKAQ